MSDQLLWSVGLTLVFVGFAIAFVAVVLLFLKGLKSKSGKVQGGGAVIIGPIPIIFGTDKESVKLILVLSIILVVLLLVLMVFSYGIFQWEVKKMQKEEESIWTFPMKLFLFGFLLMFAGIVVLIFAAALKGNMNVSGAGIFFIGPIPIVLGVGPHAFFAILLAAVLTIIGFVLFFWLRKTGAKA